MGENHDLFMKLGEGFREKFMQQVVSRTSPEDAVRLSFVSKLFRSVADSDLVWDSFIPPEHLHAVHPEYISESDSRKELFRLLTVMPVYFPRDDDADDDDADDDADDDDSLDSVPYFLDRWSGKRLLVISYYELSITYLDTDYWDTKRGIPRLCHVVWLEIKGRASTSKLSPNTTYTAYLVYSLSDEFYYGFHVPIETSVGITEEESINQFVYLDPRIAKSECQYMKHRDDTLLEVELGDYFHNDGENRDLEMTVREVKSGKPKCGIGFHYMELRPKRGRINLYCKSYHLTHSYAERTIERREGVMSKEEEEGFEGTNLFSKLPEGFAQAFMEEVVSRTSPVDACRLSVVAKSFRSAAESDVVWERFLPSDYQQFFCLANSLPDISFTSKKDLYLFLVGNHPLLIDANLKSFWLDKWSGKKCFMITTSVTQHPYDDEYADTGGCYRDGHNNFFSRFVEVRGKICTSMLSTDTTYIAFLIHKTIYYGGSNYPKENPIPFEASVGRSGDESINRVVYLDPKTGETGSPYAVERKDGWLEVELGEYYNKGGENKDLEMSVMEVTSKRTKYGSLIQGIEIRPKHC